MSFKAEVKNIQYRNFRPANSASAARQELMTVLKDLLNNKSHQHILLIDSVASCNLVSLQELIETKDSLKYLRHSDINDQVNVRCKLVWDSKNLHHVYCDHTILTMVAVDAIDRARKMVGKPDVILVDPAVSNRFLSSELYIQVIKPWMEEHSIPCIMITPAND